MRPKNSPAVREEPTFIEAARREQIVRSAIDTIAQLGYPRASLAEIAKRAGISKSVISYYFESKDDLMRKVLEEIFTTGRAFMTARVTAQDGAAAALAAYLRSNVEYMGAYRPQLIALVEIIANFRNEDGRPAVGPEANAAAEAELKGLLKWGQESGEFRQFSTGVMAITIRAAIDALPWRLALAPDLDLDAYARELIELFDRATALKPASHSAEKRRTPAAGKGSK